MFQIVLLSGILISSMVLTACKPAPTEYYDNRPQEGYNEQGYGPSPGYNQNHLGSDALKVGAGMAIGKMWSDHQNNKNNRSYHDGWAPKRNRYQGNYSLDNRPRQWQYQTRRPQGNPISESGWRSAPSRSRQFRSSPRARYR